MNDNDQLGILIFKLVASMMTWGMAALTISLINIEADFWQFLSIAFIIIAVIITNLVLWGGSEIFSSEASEESSEKRKNTGSELESALMLLQMLDSNERDIIKKRLLNNTHQEDGELGEIIESTSKRR